MATAAAGVVLGILGSKVGALTAAAVTIAATAIDQFLIFPAVFGKDLEGPKLDDLPLPNSTEGNPFNFCVGQARTNSSITWLSDIFDPDDGTGRIFQSGMSLACSREAKDIVGVWGEGKPIFDKATGVTISSDNLTLGIQVLQTFSWPPEFDGMGGPNYPFTAVGRELWTLTSPSNGPDLRNLVVGGAIIANGFGNPENDLPLGVVSKLISVDPTLRSNAAVLEVKVKNTGLSSLDGGTFTQVEVRFIVTSSNVPTGIPTSTGGIDLFTPYFTAESAGALISITQSNPIFTTPDALGGVNFNFGAKNQPVDPAFKTFETVLGEPTLPNYHGFTGVTLNGFDLSTIGLRFPGLDIIGVWDFQPFTVKQAAEVIFQEHGRIDPDFYDVSQLVEEQTFRGISVIGVQETKTLLRALVLAYDLVIAPRNGKLTLLERKNLPRIAINEEDLGAGEPGRSRVDGVQFGDPRFTTLPTHINVQYQDPDLDYQTGSQLERIDTADESVVSIEDVSFNNIVLTTQEAREAAFRLAHAGQVNAREAETFLPPSLLSVVQTADVLQFDLDGNPYDLLAESVEIGEDWLISIFGLIEDENAFTKPVVSAEPPRGLQSVNPAATFLTASPQTGLPEGVPLGTNNDKTNAQKFSPGFYDAIIIDTSGPLSDEDADTVGVYIAPYSFEGGKSRGNQLLVSSQGTDGEEFVAATFEAEAGVGYVTSNTDSAVKSTVIDRSTTVTVDFVQSRWTFESVDEQTMLGGANRAYWGGEIIQWAKAKRTAPHTWVFSGLLRGRRGTERFINAHGAYEPFVILDHKVKFCPLPIAMLNSDHSFRVVHPSFNKEEYSRRTHRVQAWHTLPYAPSNLQQSRDGSDNITVTFERRSRLSHRAFGSQPVPIDERKVFYKIAVYAVDPELNPDAAFVDVGRSTEDATSFVYTAARQTTVGITPGDALWFRMFQDTELHKVEDIVEQGGLIPVPS